MKNVFWVVVLLLFIGCVKNMALANETLPQHVVKVAVQVEEPAVGEKPPSEAETLTRGYRILRVYWTPEDETFQADVDYTVHFDIELEEGYLLRSDYVGIVNGKDAVMPVEYTKTNFLSYTFPTLRNEEEEYEIVKMTAPKMVLILIITALCITGLLLYTKDHKID